jgi:ABC-type lipoprotein export system ATPase subunit
MTSPTVSIAQPFQLPSIRSFRAREVARLFEIEDRAKQTSIEPLPCEQLRRLLPPPGRAALITGASGSGKSSLLRAVRERLASHRFLDLSTLALEETPIVDLFPGIELRPTLELLSRVGLTEAWTYLRTPAELSDGQRWRLKLALAVERAASEDAILVCDEFAALLDRVTARIVAHRLSRLIRARQVSAILATSHDDLDLALKPAIRVKCDFNLIEVSATVQDPIAASHRARSAPAR